MRTRWAAHLVVNGPPAWPEVRIESYRPVPLFPHQAPQLLHAGGGAARRVGQKAPGEVARVRAKHRGHVAVVVEVVAGLHHQGTAHARLLRHSQGVAGGWWVGRAGRGWGDAEHALGLCVQGDAARRPAAGGRTFRERSSRSPPPGIGGSKLPPAVPSSWP